MGVRGRTSKEGSGRMAQQGRIVGIDVAKLKADACIRSLQLRLSQPSTAQGQQDMITWLRRNEVGLAVMEASGGFGGRRGGGAPPAPHVGAGREPHARRPFPQTP